MTTTHAGLISAMAVRSPLTKAAYRSRTWLSRSLSSSRSSVVHRLAQYLLTQKATGPTGLRRLALRCVCDPFLQLGLDLLAPLRQLLETVFTA
jgi:hypothetical protein